MAVDGRPYQNAYGVVKRLVSKKYDLLTLTRSFSTFRTHLY